MTRPVLLRLSEGFFRHPILHTFPLVVLAAVGFWYVGTLETEYRSTGVLVIEDDSVLSQITNRGGPENGWNTPAGFASNQLNALLSTTSFVEDVAEDAGIVGVRVEDVREDLASWASGEHLLTIAATHESPSTARALADATIENLREWKIDLEVAQSSAGEDLVGPLTERYGEELEEARAALVQYLDANPALANGELTASAQLAVDRLVSDVAAASDRYRRALDHEESLQLVTAKASADVYARYQVVDAPEVPARPLTGRKRIAMVAFLFIAVGLTLSAASLVASVVTDTSIRIASDVERRIGVPLVATVSNVRGWRHATAPGR